MDANIQDGDGTTTDPIQSALLLSADLQRAYTALQCEPMGKLARFNAQTLKLLAKFLGKSIKGVTKSVFLGILSDYVSTDQCASASTLLTLL